MRMSNPCAPVERNELRTNRTIMTTKELLDSPSFRIILLFRIVLQTCHMFGVSFSLYTNCFILFAYTIEIIFTLFFTDIRLILVSARRESFQFFETANESANILQARLHR